MVADDGAERQAGSDLLVELARIGPGHTVLDVATGIGEPAVTAAYKVGPTGTVIATDQATLMLAVARERVAALGLTNVEFREIDAEALDFQEPRFDAVLSRWGLMFLPNLTGALANMRRLLKPGGRLARAVWGARQTFRSSAWRSLRSGSSCNPLRRHQACSAPSAWRM